MAGRSRLRRLTQDELISELRSLHDDAAGWISQAEDAGRQAGIEPALGPLQAAAELIDESRRRWLQAVRYGRQLRKLLERCNRLIGTGTYGRQLRRQVDEVDRQLRAATISTSSRGSKRRAG